MKEMSFPKSKCSSRIYTSSTVDSQLIESRHVKQTVINKTDSIFASYNWKSLEFRCRITCCNNGIFIHFYTRTFAKFTYILVSFN